MFSSIKTRIIVTACLFVAISLMISGGVAYYYCFSLLQTQFLKDEHVNVSKTARQIEYIADDIQKFALHIALDNDVQQYLKGNISSFYQKYSQMQTTKNKISTLEVQRDYIYNIVLVKENELIMSNSKNKDGLDETNYMKMMEQPWYQDLIFQKSNAIFSSTYEIALSGGTTKVLPFVVDVIDLSNPERKIGKLIVNITYSHFKKYLDTDSIHSDDYFWMDARNHNLFQKNLHAMEIGKDEVNLFVKRTEEGKSSTYNTRNGYLIVDRSMNNGWVLASYVLKERILEKSQSLLHFFVYYTLIILIITILVILPTVSSITKPLLQLTKAMKQVAKGNMDVSIEVNSRDELKVLGDGFNLMLYNLKSYIQRTVEYEKEKRNIELSLLIAQINPHFIYNTLHTVIYMASKIKSNEIVDMVRSFIAVLQDTVKINEEGLITTLQNELEAVRQYLNIQQYRYKERFNTVWEIDENLLECNVPRTILQPIVENSILHGILQRSEKGTVSIKARAHGGDMYITIEDNGVGIEKEMIHRILNGFDVNEHKGKMRSIGIANVRNRIKYICGETYGLEIHSEKNVCTQFSILLPRNLS